MANVRPTLLEIFDRMRTDGSASQPGVDVNLPRSLFGVLLTAFVGGIHESWGYLQSVAVDLFPDVAVDEALERWASIWGVIRIQTIKATGVSNLGAFAEAPFVELGRRLIRSDGVTYETTSAPALDAGDWKVNVKALIAGADGNYTGDLQLIEPVPGITNISSVISSGFDGDTNDLLRARLLAKLRKPAQGGNKSDYEGWALEVANLTRAWPRDPVAGSPDFNIYVADDSQDPPTAAGGDVTAAQTIVDANGPITANPTVLTAVFEDLDAEITITPNTAEVQTAVDDELLSMLIENAGPTVTILLSQIQEAVGRAPGLTDFTITVPVVDVTVTGTNVLHLGTTVFS